MWSLAVEVEKLTPKHICPDCGEFRMLTANGAYLCPNGHGKVICGVDATEAHRAQRMIRKWRWLETFPVAEKQKKGFTIDGQTARFKRKTREVEGKRQGVVKKWRSSMLKLGQAVPDDMTPARIDEKVWLFVPLAKQPRVKVSK